MLRRRHKLWFPLSFTPTDLRAINLHFIIDWYRLRIAVVDVYVYVVAGKSECES
jgi:hypothetical protein